MSDGAERPPVSKTPQIVPFGKYKGQPVEALAADREYCEWLAGQDWFRTRFTAIHTLIVNNFGDPAETPDHNALQARFIDNAWTRRFAVAAFGDFDMVRGCACGFVTRQEAVAKSENWNPEMAKFAAQVRAAYEAWSKSPTLPEIHGLAFESRGADVAFQATIEHLFWFECRVECKPSLGDDYPAVLRQMKANKCNVLLIGEGGYVGKGATFKQVLAIFVTAGIRVLELSDFEWIA